ncbi:hypothetical protein [Dysosmobacter sp.]|uniref:hypothetical protein n=1 Tax=Dysosmobacter sp. TaxID=2591382 RepID=UPI002A932303|nr:hypothetical protein [Dysosmobacter sp.]MDY5612525.1 hypothetical protein [Dysosmobacter sp.]
MSLEKENNAPEPEALKPETPKKENSTGSKPVIIYIMILFIAAFLLMALSFLMHQRSNTEALGDLQNSVSAMQEVQSYQDKIIELQEELAAAEDALEAQEKAADEALAAQQEELDRQNKVLEAMTDLYRLQQAYSNKDYDSCQDMIQRMETSGSIDYLPKEITVDSSVTAPYERYTQFKKAVTAILALGD